jgi:hypothetical protein
MSMLKDIVNYNVVSVYFCSKRSHSYTSNSSSPTLGSMLDKSWRVTWIATLLKETTRKQPLGQSIRLHHHFTRVVAYGKQCGLHDSSERLIALFKTSNRTVDAYQSRSRWSR